MDMKQPISTLTFMHLNNVFNALEFNLVDAHGTNNLVHLKNDSSLLT